ncbi:hypothetical protein CEUSTIGMA_g11788.t1 [Chlamydomonas eustigma]|uniref:Uncharacterized protein n=1 Tax=Chlamydomonas eustigma TaxID=1157962 RepID=A0A250XMX1_9CHLO|nr:hypothetical protein CEUSTIGMA_g11788.t1 [Chlamydomonas eustigma]|eukprot:GAX84366.1 hypothetical protein CEUSTIGMA_g11788.t1 [Chlamydomonas eustigma]
MDEEIQDLIKYECDGQHNVLIRDSIMSTQVLRSSYSRIEFLSLKKRSTSARAMREEGASESTVPPLRPEKPLKERSMSTRRRHADSYGVHTVNILDANMPESHAHGQRVRCGNDSLAAKALVPFPNNTTAPPILQREIHINNVFAREGDKIASNDAQHEKVMGNATAACLPYPIPPPGHAVSPRSILYNRSPRSDASGAQEDGSESPTLHKKREMLPNLISFTPSFLTSNSEHPGSSEAADALASAMHTTGTSLSGAPLLSNTTRSELSTSPSHFTPSFAALHSSSCSSHTSLAGDMWRSVSALRAAQLAARTLEPRGRVPVIVPVEKRTDIRSRIQSSSGTSEGMRNTDVRAVRTPPGFRSELSEGGLCQIHRMSDFGGRRTVAPSDVLQRQSDFGEKRGLGRLQSWWAINEQQEYLQYTLYKRLWLTRRFPEVFTASPVKKDESNPQPQGIQINHIKKPMRVACNTASGSGHFAVTGSICSAVSSAVRGQTWQHNRARWSSCSGRPVSSGLASQSEYGLMGKSGIIVATLEMNSVLDHPYHHHMLSSAPDVKASMERGVLRSPNVSSGGNDGFKRRPVMFSPCLHRSRGGDAPSLSEDSGFSKPLRGPGLLRYVLDSMKAANKLQHDH